MTAEKVEENRLRRVAKRRGYVLTRCRYRDPQAIGYGGYMLADLQNRAVLGYSPYAFSATLKDVDDFFEQKKGVKKAERKRPASRKRS